MTTSIQNEGGCRLETDTKTACLAAAGRSACLRAVRALVCRRTVRRHRRRRRRDLRGRAAFFSITSQAPDGCTVSQLSAADINRDGSVTIGDAAMLFHYVSGLFPSLPFEEGEYARLAVHTLPEKIEYIAGEAFDYSGLVICAVYDGGKRVPLEDYSLSVLGSSSPGVKIVRVTAGGLQTAFTLTVLPETLTGIELTSLPTSAAMSSARVWTSPVCVSTRCTLRVRAVPLPLMRLTGLTAAVPARRA